MQERTDAITNEVLEPNTFILAYPTVLVFQLLVQSQCSNINTVVIFHWVDTEHQSFGL